MTGGPVRAVPAHWVRSGAVACGVAVVVLAVLSVTALLSGAVGHAGLLWLVAIVAVAVVVPLVSPGLGRVADRLAYGREGDPYAALSDFVRRTSDALAIEDVLPQLARTAALATRSRRGEVRLWLADGAEWVQTWPPTSADAAADVVVPLRHAGQELGRLEVARGDDLGGVDPGVLQRLAGPAGLAASNVRLTVDLRHQVAVTAALAEQLRASRERLLVARADQVERLLARLEVDVLRRLDEADEALDTAGGDTVPVIVRTAALAETRISLEAGLDGLREISHGIYPPVLAQRGLVAALEWHRDRADRAWELRCVPPGSWRVDPHAEEAAYFACIALVPDRAGEVSVVVSADGASLQVRVRAGMAADRLSVRLARDRVEALEGSLDIDEATHDVTIRLPARMMAP